MIYTFENNQFYTTLTIQLSLYFSEISYTGDLNLTFFGKLNIDVYDIERVIHDNFNEAYYYTDTQNDNYDRNIQCKEANLEYVMNILKLGIENLTKQNITKITYVMY